MGAKYSLDIKVVRHLMKEKNIDRQELAELTKIRPAAIGRLLKGVGARRISAVMFFNIARALDAELHELIHRNYTIVLSDDYS